MNVEIIHTCGQTSNNLLLHAGARLLHFRGLEVWGKGGNLGLQETVQVFRRRAETRSGRAIYDSVWVSRKNLPVVGVGIIKFEVRRGEAIIGDHRGGVDLRDARVEPTIAGAKY